MSLVETAAAPQTPVPWRRIEIFNRTSSPITVSMRSGDDDFGLREIGAEQSFKWGLRIGRIVEAQVTPQDGKPTRLELDLRAKSISHALIVTPDGIDKHASNHRLGPDHKRGIRRVQVGCGPHNLFPDWWNVDIRDFPGVDGVMDVTQTWPYSRLDYIYGEHFIEHLDILGALKFLSEAGRSLRAGGVIRLTTPNLEWVVRSHYPVADDGDKMEGTFAINRAFHGWGHQFLYSEPFLRFVLERLGYEGVRFFEYGQSDDPNLRHLERHGGFRYAEGVPNLLVVEATSTGQVQANPELVQLIRRKFERYVTGGH